MLRSPCRVLLCVSLFAACGAEEVPVAREMPRPVEVYSLSEIDPVGPSLLAGSVSSWKDQDVSFEVGGRLLYVQESGTVLEGRWEEDGVVRVEGQLLARIDDEPYRIAIAAAEAEVAAAQGQIGVVEAQIATLLPANLRAAEAEQAQAEAEYQRYAKAGETSAVSGVDVLRAKTTWDLTQAQVDQAEGAFAGREAEMSALEANLALAGQRVEDTRWKAARCELFAPFTGEVSEVFVEAGGIVDAGQPVAHLVMMDPMQVDIAVSAETLRSLERYTSVQLAIPGTEGYVTGRLYDLATVADPRTRTFRVSIIVRNQRRIGNLQPGDPDLALPRIQRLLVPLKSSLDPAGPWFAESRRSLRQDDEGWFVWASADPARPEDVDRERPVLTLRKVRVTPGERHLNYQGIYVLRELVDDGGLDRESILPLDVPADFPDGGRALLDDSGWMLQPGQIVSVLLDEAVPEPGLFVPMIAVLPESETVGRVFVVEDGRARAVRLDISERLGPLVRVKALAPEDAQRVGPGAQVVRQAHFLLEGEAVRVVRTREVGL